MGFKIKSSNELTVHIFPEAFQDFSLCKLFAKLTNTLKREKEQKRNLYETRQQQAGPLRNQGSRVKDLLFMNLLSFFYSIAF